MFNGLMLCLLLGAPPEGLPADKDPAVVRDIKALELRLADLIVRGEIDTYSTFLADEYSRINDRGEVQTRDEVLRQFRKGTRGGTMEPTDLVVQSYGDTAILTGILRLKGPQASDPVRSSRFRKVFIRRGGKWYLVSLQGVPWQPPAEPSPAP